MDSLLTKANTSYPAHQPPTYVKMKSQRQDASIPQNSQIQRTLLTHLRHELSTPMNAIIGYSEMLLEELEAQPDSDLFSDLQKIHICGVQLLTANVILDPAQVEINQPGWDIDTFDSIIRLELLTPLSNVVGYCEMLLKKAPAALIPDLNRIHAASQHSLSMINEIINLAAQQLQMINTNQLGMLDLTLESPTTTEVIQNATTTIRSFSEVTKKQIAQGGTILVVDDNETNCDLSRQLERQGYTVATAANGHLALRMLKAIPFDLILLDIIMPEMNRLELLQQIKTHEDWRHIPVIMLSAVDEIESIVKCIELGAEDYLHKPFNPTLLKARIGSYVEKKRLRDQEILYVREVERLTTAAMQVEAKSFDPDSLADLALRTDKLGQLGRLFQHIASEVNSREQRLEQQVHMLDVVINEAQKKRMVVDIAETDHFRQIQKRARGQRQAGEAEQQRHVHTGSLAKKSFPAPHLATSSPQIISVHSFRGGTGKSNLTSFPDAAGSQ